MTAPAGSETVPVIVPRSVCANAVNVIVNRLRTSKRIRTALFLLQAMRNFHGNPGLCPKRFKAQTKWECRLFYTRGLSWSRTLVVNSCRLRWTEGWTSVDFARGKARLIEGRVRPMRVMTKSLQTASEGEVLRGPCTTWPAMPGSELDSAPWFLRRQVAVQQGRALVSPHLPKNSRGGAPVPQAQESLKGLPVPC